MMNWYNDGSGTGSWVAMAVLMLVVLALVALGLWAVLRSTGRDTRTSVTETPRATLDRRLAAGEIDAEQYAQLRRLLEGHSTPEVPHSTQPGR